MNGMNDPTFSENYDDDKKQELVTTDVAFLYQG